jgi:hypothetical protein
MQTAGTRGRFSRAELLSTGAKRGAALVVVGSAFGALTQTAAASDQLSDNDLAFARLLVGVELFSIDFYARALAAGRFRAVGHKYLRNAFNNEVDHYRSVSGILTGAGYQAATEEDFEFSYPSGTFKSRGSIARRGRELETLFLGSYLGAVAVVAPALTQPLARIAASEAQHLSLWGYELGGRPGSAAFPAPFTIDEVSTAMDAYAA